MQQYKSGKAGKITIGISPSKSIYLISDMIKNLRKKYPDITIKLYEDWIANGTGFEYSDYTDDGRLYLDDGLDLDNLTMNLTIDLNGHTISRNLTSATSDGHVLYMNIDGSVTITDSSDGEPGTLHNGNDWNRAVFHFNRFFYRIFHINA